MVRANLIYTWFILAILFGACSVTKLVPENQHLLTKNNIELDRKTNVDLSEQANYLGQRPNRRLGPIRFHLRAYQFGAKGLQRGKDSTWWRKTLINIGEPPVIVDTVRCELSSNRLSDFYFSKGFLNNSVSYSIEQNPWFKKRAKIRYMVSLGQVQSIGRLSYNSTSMEIERLIDSSSGKSFLKVGRLLDFQSIQKERARITQLLKDRGYYYFNNSYIDFSLDTNRSKSEVDIVVNIRNNRDLAPHLRQKINRVLVLVGEGSNTDTIAEDGIQVLLNSYYINPEVLVNNIFFRPGEYYNASEVQRSYSSLLGVGLFRFVTIRFSPARRDSAELLNAVIVLQTASKHDFIWEPQAITTEQGSGIEAAAERNFGIGNNISLRNRNVFGNGESFNINLSTALETQFKSDSIRAFSNFRQSASTELIIPTLLFFKRKDWNLSTKSTKFTASYLYDRNVNYVRHVLPFSYSYNFQRKKTIYTITPLRVSFNRSIVETSFLDGLSPESKQYINQLLTNNLISGPLFSMYWNSKHKNPKRYWSIRSNPLELSGNLFTLYYRLFSQQTGFNKEVLGVKYSQYARTDIDLSYLHTADENNAFAYRFYAGIGLPYGNTEFLPFERRFFVGGGNSLRAWRPRTLGPGTYSDDNSGSISIEKTGEMMLQFNTEYRFNIIRNFVNGAIFVDAGNIWNLKPNDNFPNGEFKGSEFYRQVALNTGLGMRFDLSYLVFRIDWGLALHDPSDEAGNRWVIRDFNSLSWIGEHSALNFAVGYPF